MAPNRTEDVTASQPLPSSFVDSLAAPNPVVIESVLRPAALNLPAVRALKKNKV